MALMQTDAELTNEYFDVLDELDGDIESRRQAYEYIQGSNAIVHGEVVPTTFIPKLFSLRTYETMKRASETMHAILEKVITHYLDDEEYRSLFDFDDRLIELILMPRGYEEVIPFMRADIFLNEDTQRFMFCEINADGISGMNTNRQATRSISDSETFTTFAENHKLQACTLLTPYVDAFMDVYESYEHKRPNPHVAICDYLDHGVVHEFDELAQRFEARGIESRVIDVRTLRYDDEVLTDEDGWRVDAILRRCVTNDVIEFWDESQALIEAVRAQKVALIGSFAGHIVHDKQIFQVLFAPDTQNFLTAEEISFIEQTVPMTAFLDESQVNLAQIAENKDEWIIKPSDHYGADNVYAGCDFDDKSWRSLVERFANGREGYPFIVQRYVTQYKTKTLPSDEGIESIPDGEVSSTPVFYNNLSGLYLYNGTFQGVYSRLGPNPTISFGAGCVIAATIWVDADVEGAVDLA